MGGFFKIEGEGTNTPDQAADQRSQILEYANHIREIRSARQEMYIGELSGILSMNGEGQVDCEKYGLEGELEKPENVAGFITAWCMYKGMDVETLTSPAPEAVEARKKLILEFHETFSEQAADTDEIVDARRITTLLEMQKMMIDLGPALPDTTNDMSAERFAAYEKRADLNARMTAAVSCALFESGRNRSLLREHLGAADIDGFAQKVRFENVHAAFNRLSEDMADVAFSLDFSTEDLHYIIDHAKKGQFSYKNFFNLDSAAQLAQIAARSDQEFLEAAGDAMGRIAAFRTLAETYDLEKLENIPLYKIDGAIRQSFTESFGKNPRYISVDEYIETQLSSAIQNVRGEKSPAGKPGENIHPLYTLLSPIELISEVTDGLHDDFTAIYINGRNMKLVPPQETAEAIRTAFKADSSSFVTVRHNFNTFTPIMPPYGSFTSTVNLSERDARKQYDQKIASSTEKADQVHGILSDLYGEEKKPLQIEDASTFKTDSSVSDEELIGDLADRRIHDLNDPDNLASAERIVKRIFIDGRNILDIVKKDPDKDFSREDFKACADYLRDHIEKNTSECIVIVPRALISERSQQTDPIVIMPKDSAWKTEEERVAGLAQKNNAIISAIGFALNIKENFQKTDEYNNNKNVCTVNTHGGTVIEDIIGSNENLYTYVVSNKRYEEEVRKINEEMGIETMDQADQIPEFSQDPYDDFLRYFAEPESPYEEAMGMLSQIVINGKRLNQVLKDEGLVTARTGSTAEVLKAADVRLKKAISSDSTEYMAVKHRQGYRAVMPALENVHDFSIIDEMNAKAEAARKAAEVLSDEKLNEIEMLNREIAENPSVRVISEEADQEKLIESVLGLEADEFKNASPEQKRRMLGRIYVNGQNISAYLDRAAQNGTADIDQAAALIRNAFKVENQDFITVMNENSIEPRPVAIISGDNLNHAVDLYDKHAKQFMDKINDSLEYAGNLRQDVFRAVQESLDIYANVELYDRDRLHEYFDNNPSMHFAIDQRTAADLVNLYLLSKGYTVEELLSDSDEIREARREMAPELFSALGYYQGQFADRDTRAAVLTDMAAAYAKLKAPYVDFNDPESIRENLPKAKLISAMGKSFGQIDAEPVKGIIDRVVGCGSNLRALTDLRVDYIMNQAYMSGHMGNAFNSETLVKGIKAQAAIDLAGNDSLKQACSIPAGNLDPQAMADVKIEDTYTDETHYYLISEDAFDKVRNGDFSDVKQAWNKERIEGFAAGIAQSRDIPENLAFANIVSQSACPKMNFTMEEYQGMSGKSGIEILSTISGIPLSEKSSKELLLAAADTIYINGIPLSLALHLSEESDLNEKGRELYETLESSLVKGLGHNFVMVKNNHGNFEALEVENPPVAELPVVEKLSGLRRIFCFPSTRRASDEAYDNYVRQIEPHNEAVRQYGIRKSAALSARSTAGDLSGVRIPLDVLSARNETQRQVRRQHSDSLENHTQRTRDEEAARRM